MLDLRFIRELQHADQALEAFRRSYADANDEARAQARDYVNALAALTKTNVAGLPWHEVSIFTVDNSSAKEGDVIPMQLPVSILAKAIAAWDKGEIYPPTALDMLEH